MEVEARNVRDRNSKNENKSTNAIEDQRQPFHNYEISRDFNLNLSPNAGRTYRNYGFELDDDDDCYPDWVIGLDKATIQIPEIVVHRCSLASQTSMDENTTTTGTTVGTMAAITNWPSKDFGSDDDTTDSEVDISKNEIEAEEEIKAKNECRIYINVEFTYVEFT